MRVLPTGADWGAPDPDARNAEIADELREVITHLQCAVDLLDPIGGAS